MGLVSGTRPDGGRQRGQPEQHFPDVHGAAALAEPGVLLRQGSVRAALASPFTIGLVMTSRMASATHEGRQRVGAVGSNRPASPVSRAAASASSAGHSALATRSRSARRCRCGEPRNDQASVNQPARRVGDDGYRRRVGIRPPRPPAPTRPDPACPCPTPGPFGRAVARSSPLARMRCARTWALVTRCRGHRSAGSAGSPLTVGSTAGAPPAGDSTCRGHPRRGPVDSSSVGSSSSLGVAVS